MIRTATAAMSLVLVGLAAPALEVAAVSADPGPTASPAQGDINGPIVFESTRDGNSELYRMNPDLTDPIRLTTNTAADTAPSVTSDGSTVYFVSNRDGNNEIYRTSVRGGDAFRLTTNAASDHMPAISPDGQYVAFVSYRDHPSGEVYRMNADGSGVVRLTNNTGVDTGPAFSPDGQHIVFSGNSATSGVNYDIIRIGIDGSSPTRLTTDARADLYPEYSPDGQHIVFAANLPWGVYGIYRMNADGSGTVVLTTPDDINGDVSPTYSPDGQTILLASDRDRTPGRHQLYMTDADTFSTPWQVTSEGDNGAGDWTTGSLSCRGQYPTLEGGPGNDVLVGYGGPEVILGYGGDDVIVGGGGADLVCGGPGSDTVDYRAHELDVVADLDSEEGDDGSAEDGPPGARDTLHRDVENIVGGYGDDMLTAGSPAGVRAVLDGGPGDDTLSGFAYYDLLVGGSGDDLLVGSHGNDTLRGGTGLDHLDGGPGSDMLDGGNDADVLDGGAVTLFGDADTATYARRTTAVTVRLGFGDGDDGNATDGPAGYRDTVRGTVERVIGGRGDDLLTGSGGDNRLTGGPGADRLRGLAGVDTLVARDSTADLLIDCGDGADRPAVHDASLDPQPVSCP